MVFLRNIRKFCLTHSLYITSPGPSFSSSIILSDLSCLNISQGTSCLSLIVSFRPFLLYCQLHWSVLSVSQHLLRSVFFIYHYLTRSSSLSTINSPDPSESSLVIPTGPFVPIVGEF